MKFSEIHKYNSYHGVAYHGSGELFKEFDQNKARIANDYWGGGVGYFTRNKNIAKLYAKAMSKITKTPYVYTVNLSLEKIFDQNDTFSGSRLINLLPKDLDKFSRGAGLMSLHYLENIDKFLLIHKLKKGDITLTGKQVFFGLSGGGINTSVARKTLIKNGYDALRYEGGVLMGVVSHDVFVVYFKKSIEINDIEKLNI